MEYIKNQIKDSVNLKIKILESDILLKTILRSAQICITALKTGNKILLAGNGGSAADAQHLAGELVNRFYFNRPGLPAMALTTDSSVITSIANDYGYEMVFARQLTANGTRNDVFIAISTSGSSPNIINALKTAKESGIITIGLTGSNGFEMAELCDSCIIVPSVETPRIQEAHILIGHILCSFIEKEMFGK
jgi:D-sedoheptulose 7-phosphate isomerase